MRRGLILNVISNVVFFLAGYAIHYFLGNTLPPVAYGVVGTIMTVLDFEYMFLSNGGRQFLAKEISMRHYDTGDLIRKSSLFQLFLIFVFFAINYFGAKPLAMLLNDPSLERYFQIAALLVPANGLFVLLLGITDGIRHFTTTALLNMIYPIAKMGAIPLIIVFFRDDPIAGLEFGYLFALLLCIGLSLLLLIYRRGELRSKDLESKRIPLSSTAHRMLSFSIFFIMVSLVLSVDTLIVKSVVRPASMTGYYTGAVNFGKIPYYLMTAFFTIILPVVAHDIGKNDTALATLHVKRFLMLIASFVLPISTIISASSSPLLATFYNERFTAAAPALSLLSFSSLFMGMTVLLNMVLTSFASNRFSDALSIVSLVIVVPAFVTAAHHGGITAVAATSMVSTAITMMISLVAVMRKTGNIITSPVLITLGANVLLWLATTVLFTFVFDSVNLLGVAAIDATLYAVYVGSLIFSRLVRWPKNE